MNASLDDALLGRLALHYKLATEDQLLAARKHGLHFDTLQTSFFLSRFNLKSGATNTFTGALNFSDPQSGIYSNRFYRAVSP